MDSGSDDQANEVAVDATGSVFLVGYVGASVHGQAYSGGEADVILMKYAFNGTRIWTKLLGGTLRDEGRGIALNSTGNVIITGYASSSINGQPFSDLYDILYAGYSNTLMAWQPTALPTFAPTSR